MNNQKVWDDIYQSGHEQRAPWDTVVSFVYRHKPQGANNKDVRILEVGCGTASNLRFFAHEGFQVVGIDFSPKAIASAQLYFEINNLKGDFSIGSFETLELPDDSVDMAVDRAALTCAGLSGQKKAIKEIHRVLKKGGKFLYTPYADTHSSCLNGQAGEDGIVDNIKVGTLQGVGALCFANRSMIEEIFSSDLWNIISMEYETSQDMLQDESEAFHSSWRVIVEKK